jgi:hypothetical protein
VLENKAMRDIRPDLTQRLAAIESERQILEKRLSELEQTEFSIRVLLGAEDQSWSGSPQIALFEGRSEDQQNGKYNSPWARFVLSTLSEQGPCDLSMLKRIALKKAIGFGDKSPGRALNRLLLGMLQNGLVEKVGDGTWKLKENKIGQ